MAIENKEVEELNKQLEQADTMVAGADATQDMVNPNQYVAIDFKEAYEQMNTSLEYVNATRDEFEKGPGPQKWISDLVALLESTLTKIREYQVEHQDETFEWEDDNGLHHRIYTKFQDPKGFTELMAYFQKAEQGFHDYFEKHAELVSKEFNS